jgi:hypothetical protein
MNNSRAQCQMLKRIQKHQKRKKNRGKKGKNIEPSTRTQFHFCIFRIVYFALNTVNINTKSKLGIVSWIYTFLNDKTNGSIY